MKEKKIKFDFSKIETQESQLNNNLIYQAKILLNSNKKIFAKRAITYPFRKISSKNNKSREPRSNYFDFTITQPIYDDSSEVGIISKKSSTTKIQINAYRNRKTIKLNQGIDPTVVPIEFFEIGHNIISSKEKIDIGQILFFLKDTKERAKRTSNPQVTYARYFDDYYINGAISFLFNSCVRQPASSPFHGSCYAIYDYHNKCHRKPHWIWSDAPVVAALINTDINGHNFQYSKKIAETMCNLQWNEPPLDGAILSRYRRYGHHSYPFEALFGPNDTSFIVRWALLPMYEETNDPYYLQVAEKALGWVSDCVEKHGIVPSHYYLERSKWEPRTFIDAAFLPCGFAKYYSITGNIDSDWKDSIENFTNHFINNFKLNNGFYGQDLHANEKKATNRLFTRGQGWVLAGLLSTYELTGKEQYLSEAVELANRLITVQTKEGYWGYLLGYNSPNTNAQRISGPCEKATTVLAYYLTKLGFKTNNQKYFTSSRQALNWCEDQMCFDSGIGYGGIKSSNRYSGITSLPFIPVATGYANAYYILSKLKHKSKSIESI